MTPSFQLNPDFEPQFLRGHLTVSWLDCSRAQSLKFAAGRVLSVQVGRRAIGAIKMLKNAYREWVHHGTRMKRMWRVDFQIVRIIVPKSEKRYQLKTEPK